MGNEKQALLGAEASGVLFYFILNLTCLFWMIFITCLLTTVILEGMILPPTLLMQEYAVFDQQYCTLESALGQLCLEETDLVTVANQYFFVFEEHKHLF